MRQALRAHAADGRTGSTPLARLARGDWPRQACVFADLAVAGPPLNAAGIAASSFSIRTKQNDTIGNGRERGSRLRDALMKEPRRMRRGEKTKTPEEAGDPGGIEWGYMAPSSPVECPFRARARLPYAARDGVAPTTRMLQLARAALASELVKARRSLPKPPPHLRQWGVGLLLLLCCCLTVQGPSDAASGVGRLWPRGSTVFLRTVSLVPAVNPLLGALSHLRRLPRPVAKATSCTCCRLRCLPCRCRAN